jgi:hypothetical protein
MSKALDISKEPPFGRLTALRRAPDRRGRTMWLCRCECGVELTVALATLRRGLIKSCGCLRADASRKRRKFDEATEDRIVEAYHETQNPPAVAERFDCLPTTLHRILKRRGVKVRSVREAARNPSTRHDYFREISTEEQAWWLGWLATDGNVSERGYITLQLAVQDEAHVFRFRDTFCPTVAPIQCPPSVVRGLPGSGRCYMRQEQLRVSFGSVEMLADLARLGIFPRKSHTVQPWRTMTAALQAAYWRGCFEGDGCIYRTRRADRRGGWSVGFCGNRSMVEGFESFVRETLEVPAQTIHAGTGCFQVCWQARDTVRGLTAVLYGNATCWLDRKKQLVDELLSDPH